MGNATVAVDSLFEERGLRQLLNRWVGPQDADDVLQIVAEKLLRSDSGADLSPSYVSRVARNAAIDQTRTVQSRSGYESEFTRHRPWKDELSPERIVEGIQAIEALDNALMHLPELTQEVFLLYYVDGLQQLEIAEHFGLHVSSIEKHLAKARRRCYERIEPHLAEE